MYVGGTRRRILQGTAATLTFRPVDSDGEPSTTDPGTVTVGVTRSDGTTVVTAGTATTPVGVTRTYALTATHTADLDVLTATWTVAGTTVGTTVVDVVGGYYFTTAELRAGESSARSESKVSDTQIIDTRAEVETFFERVQNVSWVPRLSTYRRANIPALDQIVLPQPFLRAVRWGRLWTSTTEYTAFTTAECDAIPPSDLGIVNLPYTVTTTYGLELGVEQGLDSPPHDVKWAAMRLCRVYVNRALEPSKSQPLTTIDGPVMPARTGTRWRPTGYEDIDEVLMSTANNFTRPGIA